MTLCEIIVSCRDYMEHFNRHEYVEYFKKFSEMTAPVLEAVEDPHAEAVELMNGLEAVWAQEKRSRRRSFLRERDKLTICCYFNPLATNPEFPCGTQLADEIHALWIEKYPKEGYSVGTYDAIMKGFEPRIFGFKLNRD